MDSDTFATNIFALEIVDLVYCRENFVSITLQSPDLWVIFKDKIKNIIEADLQKYEEGDDEVSSSILDDFDKEKYQAGYLLVYIVVNNSHFIISAKLLCNYNWL